MFSKKMTNKSTNACLAQINRLKEKMEKADAVIIGAGAGLSTSAGFTYSGLTDIFQTLLLNMAFPICTPAAFIRLKP